MEKVKMLGAMPCAIASVVLVVLARTSIASVVLARTAMMLVEARAMVAVASVVARAMVVARSAGGVSPIYMVVRRRGSASRWGGRSSMCCSICAIVRARGSGVSRGCDAPIRRSRCRDSY